MFESVDAAGLVAAEQNAIWDANLCRNALACISSIKARMDRVPGLPEDTFTFEATPPANLTEEESDEFMSELVAMLGVDGLFEAWWEAGTTAVSLRLTNTADDKGRTECSSLIGL